MSSTTTNSRPRARWVFLAMLGALMLLALAQVVPAQAATAYTGGPQVGFYPLYVSNDHSVCAVRIEATDGLLDKDGVPLAAVGTYYVKIRISPTATPSGSTSRGFTWNSTTSQWVQERENWDQFPIVTTDASGHIVGGNTTWYYFKFGDTTKPTASNPNPWYLVVSLQPTDGGSGTTQNNASAPAVTIMDSLGTMSDVVDSFRIHNGVSTGATATRRVEAAASGSAAQTGVWSLSRTENNSVDDGNGTDVGGFGLAVPVGLAFDVKIQDAVWPVAATSFTGAVTNADIAYGVADTTPPAAPTGFTKTMDGTTAHLSWDAVGDASSYVVYQWQDATPVGGATNYTPRHAAIDTVAGVTTYDATGLAADQTYHFEVRASDAAGNLSPPSTFPSQLTLESTATTVNWGGQATLTGALTDGSEAFSATQQVRAESSTDGATWTLMQLLDPGTSSVYSIAVTPTEKTQYRLVFEGDGVHAAATSLAVTVTPRVKLGKPAAPTTVKHGRRFTARGSLVPKHKAGSKTVKIKCYKKVSGKWRLKKTVTAVNANYKSYTRYSVRMALSSKGSWKLVATYAANDDYAKTTSKAEFLKVN